MFIFCRNIGLSIFNISSVLIIKKIKNNYLYGHSISVTYASPAHSKMKEIKLQYTVLFSRYIKSLQLSATTLVLSIII